jgi:Domain of unknown function (DUF4124)
LRLGLDLAHGERARHGMAAKKLVDDPQNRHYDAARMSAINEKIVFLSPRRRSSWRARAARFGCVAGCAVLFGISALVPAAQGQRIYRWTDEKGTVHFSQEPPENVKDVEVKDLPVPDTEPTAAPSAAPAPAKAVSTPANVTPAAEAATPAAASTKKPVSPQAQVDVVKQQSISMGGENQAISGKVENKGGSKARNVVVTVTVTETVQGAQCLHQDIPVRPSSLNPGETGEFSANFQNPCFYGPTKVDLQPNWQ